MTLKKTNAFLPPFAPPPPSLCVLTGSWFWKADGCIVALLAPVTLGAPLGAPPPPPPFWPSVCVLYIYRLYI